jgi:hypothetical protein
VLAVAWIVSSDVRARGRGTVALYQARADVAVQFLRLAERELVPSSLELNETFTMARPGT